MLVYVATSLNLNWIVGLFDESLFHVYIVLIIVIGLLLSHLYRSGENKEEEPEHPINESDRDEQVRHLTSEYRGAKLRRHTPCAFCGNPSTTRCARCKVARYCSGKCQIGHWWSWHKYECFEIDSEEGEARHVHAHETPMLVEEKYNNHGSLNSNMGVDDDESSRRSDDNDMNKYPSSCEECGSPSTTKCSRCKAVRYCSTKCLITNWRWHKYHCTAGDVTSASTERPNSNIGVPKHSNEEEDNIHSSSPLYLELHSEGTSNFNSPSEVISQVTTKETQRVKYIEDELLKSRKEILVLQSERDEWKRLANIVRGRFESFKEESKNQLSVLRNENVTMSNAEKKACNVIHTLHEKLNHLQIVAQETITEKRRLEENIQMIDSECVKLKKELQESKKNHEIAQIAIREVEEVKQELLQEREHVEQVKKKFIRDVKTAESRAIIAEAKFSDLQRKIKLADSNKVLAKTESLCKVCTICLSNEKDMAFGCGHMTCRDCGSKLSKCPICREQITNHIKLFPG